MASSSARIVPLVKVKNAEDHDIPVFDDEAVPGSRFGDHDLHKFHPLTDNCFYAYDDIVFIKQFEIQTFESRFDNTSKHPNLRAGTGKVKIISNLFWDLYVDRTRFTDWKKLQMGQSMKKTDTKTVLDILIKTIEDVKISMTQSIRHFPVGSDETEKVKLLINSLPVDDSWTPDTCYMVKNNDEEAFLFFEDDQYNPKKMTYYTMKQALKVLYEDDFYLFEQNVLIKILSKQKHDIPILCTFEKKIKKTMAKYTSSVKHQPFTSDQILDHLYSDPRMIFTDSKEKRLDSVQQIYESSFDYPDYPQNKLILPKKFQDSQHPTVFSTKNYQKFIAEYMFHNNGLLCWHDAGTGKTLTSIMAMIAFLKKEEQARRKGKVIIVCPASLISQWERVKREHIVPSRLDTDVKTFMEQYKKCLELQESIGVFSYPNLNNVMKEWVLGNLKKKNKNPFEDIDKITFTSASESVMMMKAFLNHKMTTKVFGVFDEIHQVPTHFLNNNKSVQDYPDVVPELKDVDKYLQPTGGYWLRCLMVSTLDKALFLTATPIQNSITDLRPILQNITILHQDPKKRYEFIYWENLVEYWKKPTMKDAIQDSWFQNSPVLPNKYPLNVKNEKTETTKTLKTTDSAPYYTMFTNGNDPLLRHELVLQEILPDPKHTKQTKPQFEARQAENMKRKEKKDMIYTYLNFVANFRGMIHRVRAVIPGRGNQRQKAVVQEDEFPQEIMCTHYLKVDESSHYFQEYKRLVKEGAVLGPLKQYAMKSQQGYSYHQGSQLYTNQTKNTSHIYTIKNDSDAFTITITFSGTYDPGHTIKKDKDTMTFESKDFYQVGRHTNPQSKIQIGSVKYPLLTYDKTTFTMKTENDVNAFKGFNTWNLEAEVIIRRNPVHYTIKREFKLNGKTLTYSGGDIKDIEKKRVVGKKETTEQILIGYQVNIGGTSYVISEIHGNTILLNRDVDVAPLKGKTTLSELHIEKPYVTEFKGGDVSLRIKRDKAMLQSTTRIPMNFKKFIRQDDSISFPINKELKTFIIKKITGDEITFTEDTKLDQIVSEWNLFTFFDPDTKNVTFKKTSLGDSKKITNPPNTYPNVIFSPKFDYLRGKIRSTKTVIHDTKHEPGSFLTLYGNDKKVVIFTHYLENLKLLVDNMKHDDFFIGRGGTPKPVILSVNEGDLIKRNRIIQQFKHEKGNVIMIISEKSATGIDLEKVTDVVFYDLVWTGSLYTQITGRGIRFRSHRGLPLDQRMVRVHNLILCSPDPDIQFTDELMLKKIQEKNNISENLDRFLMWDEFNYPKKQKETVLCNFEKPFGDMIHSKKISGLLLNAPPPIDDSVFQTWVQRIKTECKDKSSQKKGSQQQDTKIGSSRKRKSQRQKQQQQQQDTKMDTGQQQQPQPPPSKRNRTGRTFFFF